MIFYEYQIPWLNSLPFLFYAYRFVINNVIFFNKDNSDMTYICVQDLSSLILGSLLFHHFGF